MEGVGERQQDVQTRRRWEAEGSACLGCACAGARALAAPPLSPPVFQESWGREERKLTGDGAIPVIPDEIAARALACQEVGAERPGRGRGWPEKSLANSFPTPSCLSAGDPRCGGGKGGSELGLEEGHLGGQQRPVTGGHLSPPAYGRLEAPRCPGGGPGAAESGFKL